MNFDRYEFELLGYTDLDPMSFYSDIYDAPKILEPESVADSNSKSSNSLTLLNSEIEQILNDYDAVCASKQTQDETEPTLECCNDDSGSDNLLELEEFIFNFDQSSENDASVSNLSSDATSLHESTLSLTCEPCTISHSDSDHSPLSLTKGAGTFLPLTPPYGISDDDIMKLVKVNNGEVEEEEYLDLQPKFSSQHESICCVDASSASLDLSHYIPKKLKRKYQIDDDDEEDYYYNLPKSKSASTSELKPFSKRFKSSGFVTLQSSATQCLEVDLNYHSYTGNISKIILNNNITNFAVVEQNLNASKSLVIERIHKHYKGRPEETHCGSHNGPIGFESGVLQRKIYVRDISEIKDMVSNVFYKTSTQFNENTPYEPQYFRYELDENHKVVGESKCGLCAFCPEVRFYPFKNSSYLSHLTLMHGVYANNFVVPEGLNVGKYMLNRSSYSRKKNIIEALQCPVCFETIPIKCWKTKSNPLLSYFRHFKKMHQKETRHLVKSVIDPLNLKKPSNNLH